LNTTGINHRECLVELSREDDILLGSQGVLTALGDENGIIPLIGDVEVTPFGLYTQRATQITGDSIHVTITTIYLENFEVIT
jgi:hypothetical protein